jgi:hypothetical protein
MHEEENKDLERWTDAELRRLPDVSAPPTLLHRVMLAVHERARQPWYRRAWPTWPRPIQVASLLLLALLACGVVALTVNPTWVPGLGSMSWETPAWTAQLTTAIDRTGTMIGALGVIWRTMGQGALLCGLALVLVAYASSVGLGTVCYRLAVRRG